ncbi:hypothetical protein H696_02485 [Fonticula alba]|uniref:Uncharacterized protein n=1 Tax=Fonticula alba TaxID=691883 RepID=A0A058ZC73_FONAL|nr:hypothetical protein H696_02485 [Fonticula alba]KCV71546.1 hypothetical protein H696_02485 [Fonticula alba]|eukprot:XP_009494669.1 hypothetical protein H696_02485 [Fonticula alba]
MTFSKNDFERLVLSVLPPSGEPQSHMNETQLAQLVHYASTQSEKLSRLMLFIQASLIESHRARELPITETYVHMINAIVAKTAVSHGSIYSRHILEMICYLIRCMSADGLPLASSATSDIPLDDVRMATSLLFPLVAVRVPVSKDPLLPSCFVPLFEQMLAGFTALLDRPADLSAHDRAISRLALAALRAICLGAASSVWLNDTPDIYGRMVSALVRVVGLADQWSAEALFHKRAMAVMGPVRAIGDLARDMSAFHSVHRCMLGYHALRTLQHLASQADVSTFNWLSSYRKDWPYVFVADLMLQLRKYLDASSSHGLLAYLIDRINAFEADDLDKGTFLYVTIHLVLVLRMVFEGMFPSGFSEAGRRPAPFALPSTEDHSLYLADLGEEEPARGEYQWDALLAGDAPSADRPSPFPAGSLRLFGSGPSATGTEAHGIGPSPMRMPIVEMLECCLGHWSLRYPHQVRLRIVKREWSSTPIISQRSVALPPLDTDPFQVEDLQSKVFKLCWLLLSLAEVLIRRIDTLTDRMACSLSILRIVTALAGGELDEATMDHRLPVLVNTAGRIARAPPVLDAFAKAHGGRLLASLTSVFGRELSLTSAPAPGADPLSMGDILGLVVALADYTGLQAAAAASDGMGDPAVLPAAGGPAVAVVVAALAAAADSASASPSTRAAHTHNLLALVACLYLSRLSALVPAAACPVPTSVHEQLLLATRAAVDLAALAAALPEFEPYLTDLSIALSIAGGIAFAPEDLTYAPLCPPPSPPASIRLVAFDWVGLASALACSADKLGTEKAGLLFRLD